MTKEFRIAPIPADVERLCAWRRNAMLGKNIARNPVADCTVIHKHSDVTDESPSDTLLAPIVLDSGIVLTLASSSQRNISRFGQRLRARLYGRNGRSGRAHATGCTGLQLKPESLDRPAFKSGSFLAGTGKKSDFCRCRQTQTFESDRHAAQVHHTALEIAPIPLVACPRRT
jgi:hypothetical protein